MKILKSWLQKHIEEPLPSDEVIEQSLILKSSEVESIEKIKIETKDGIIDDTVFDIKVLPDRAHYMLSHRGIAYDLCAVLNLTLKKEEKIIIEKSDNVIVKIESDLCNRYTALSIKNINNSSSPEWLKNSLEAIGARSINPIVDATNYAMFDTGQPLHAFDADKVSGALNVRLAKDGEKIDTLDGGKNLGKLISLRSNHLVIADDEGPLVVAGVKGGKRAIVDQNTKNIILESANFNPVTVRKTSFEIGIRNDSSKRFENEISPYLTEKGISVFLKIIKSISPECVVDSMNDEYTKLPESWEINVTHKNIESILNFKIAEKRVIEILEKLQCKISVENEVYNITPPFERLDLIIPEDIIDEIGRIEGLDKVTSVLPKANNKHEFSKIFLLTEKIKDFFYKRGFNEIQTRTFSNKGDIEVAYPMASDKSFLRTNLKDNISGAMDIAIKNSPLLGLDKIQIFEVGKTFPKSGEQLDLCFSIQYIKKIKNKEQIIKTELEEIIKELEKELKIKADSKIISNIGYINKLDDINIDIDFSTIETENSSKTIFKPFSEEPFIVRDIALFVSNNVNAEDVRKLIESSLTYTAGDLLVKGPDLFDQFEKDDKKSLAFRMIFQAKDRTLTDIEINSIMDKLYEVVKEKGWQVR